MHIKARPHSSIFGVNWSPANATLAIIITLLFLIFLFLLITLTAQPVQAQTFQVIHNFAGRPDGGDPIAGLTMDAAGNLYGTTLGGGSLHGGGSVFKLAHRGSGWVLTPLHDFSGTDNDAHPWAGVTFGPNGRLYGTTMLDDGAVFNLQPPPNAPASVLDPWTETVIHQFSGDDNDGYNPVYGKLVFDQAGNLYGTTESGGAFNVGTVYEMTPSNGGWTESVIYSFRDEANDGQGPQSGVIFDQSGNLYGTTYWSNPGWGTVYELTPSGSGWTEEILYNFQGGNDGASPIGGLLLSPSGNLYGTTPTGGMNGGGTVFELQPSNGAWVYTVLYSFAGSGGPEASLTMDAGGSFYGTTYYDGAYGWGSVFKLTPSNGGWTYTSLHDFTGGNDGSRPISDVIFDGQGNLYGTASLDGANRQGVVWEITP